MIWRQLRDGEKGKVRGNGNAENSQLSNIAAGSGTGKQEGTAARFSDWFLGETSVRPGHVRGFEGRMVVKGRLVASLCVRRGPNAGRWGRGCHEEKRLEGAGRKHRKEERGQKRGRSKRN